MVVVEDMLPMVDLYQGYNQWCAHDGAPNPDEN